ncbi:unnamed protein product [Clonostachys chloroleuca]|uniref:Uncharacterized protein n=1 Tax=Clonostachys chloroleuca TaxID=1926264 RepID=A0AA35LZ92_9HYPO|nr:unnamed protein product [Clonostachys chloroleuca]
MVPVEFYLPFKFLLHWKHSEESLRHLCLGDTKVSFSLIIELAKRCPGLSLRSLRTCDNRVTAYSVRVPEDILLNYVNNGVNPVLGSGNRGFDQSRFIRYLQSSRATRFLFTFDGEEVLMQEVGTKLENERSFLLSPDRWVELENESNETDPSQSHLVNAPRWVFDRFYHDDSDDGEVLVHQIGQENKHKGHKTELWKFTNRDGEVTYGQYPLDWWEDWDPDNGDLAEPTPYCDDLFYFVAERQSVFMAGYKSARPPLGAIRYDEDEGELVSKLMR